MENLVLPRDMFRDYGEGLIAPVIFLNFLVIWDEDEEEQMTIVAHEAAHFILGHHLLEHADFSCEKEADNLAEKWGFQRAYKEKASGP
jgi:Zn-dependent peptidase ImmA (M78 family)